MPDNSPNRTNYYVGTGSIYSKVVDSDDATYAHIGNCPKFAVTEQMDVLERNESEAGQKVVTDVFPQTRTCGVEISAEEFTPETLALCVGAVEIGSSGVYRLSTGLVYRAIKFVGANDQGRRTTCVLPRVLFGLDGSLDLIGREIMQMPLKGRSMFYRLTAGGDAASRTFANWSFP